jgi:hypothetical protein
LSIYLFFYCLKCFCQFKNNYTVECDFFLLSPWSRMAQIIYVYIFQTLGMLEGILYYCQHQLGRFHSSLLMMIITMTMMFNWG